MGYVDIAAYFFMLASMTLAPGPLIAIIIARTLNKDTAGAIAFGSGIALGDVIVICLICAGLGTWVQSVPYLFDIGKALAVCYVLWIAKCIWFGASDGGLQSKKRTGKLPMAVAAGACTCLLSPQTFLLYVLLLPRLIDVSSVTAGSFTLLIAITFGALFLTFSVAIGLTSKLGNAMVTTSGSQLFSRLLAVVVGSSGLWMVAA